MAQKGHSLLRAAGGSTVAAPQAVQRSTLAAAVVEWAASLGSTQATSCSMGASPSSSGLNTRPQNEQSRAPWSGE
ncbi:MAG: hypothetical protein GX605_06765 [Chloroflexi bacterium]|nr:hypothetical protein [Chloroflexota bacterium]